MREPPATCVKFSDLGVAAKSLEPGGGGTRLYPSMGGGRGRGRRIEVRPVYRVPTGRMIVGAGAAKDKSLSYLFQTYPLKEEFPNFLLPVGSNCVLIKSVLFTLKPEVLVCGAEPSGCLVACGENSAPLPRLIYKEVEVCL